MFCRPAAHRVQTKQCLQREMWHLRLNTGARPVGNYHDMDLYDIAAMFCSWKKKGKSDCEYGQHGTGRKVNIEIKELQQACQQIRQNI